MRHIRAALIGNPNTGKTSIFNQLTGLNQKVGNYPGITVDKKLGSFDLDDGSRVDILDLPGTYSINPSSNDEYIAINVFTKGELADKPDLAIVVSEVTQLKRNLLLFTQIKDLQIPTLLIINMADMLESHSIKLDIAKLEQELDTKVILTSVKNHQGFKELKAAIADYETLSKKPSVNHDLLNDLTQLAQSSEKGLAQQKENKQTEAAKRYQFIDQVLAVCLSSERSEQRQLSKIDKILTHHFWGYVIFFGILAVIFQAVFAWSAAPMDFIDETFSNLSVWIKDTFPSGVFTDLLAEGVVAGIGGVVIFIPQIAFLFLFISLLEESGYMSRAVFLMDKFMCKFGLSGKSVIPFVSGAACAIPGIMAARNIENTRERLITILVTPFITCSARLPVYAILISLVIPDKKLFNLINYQGLVLMFLYFLGFFGAIFSAYILHKIFKIKGGESFVIEMPDYKCPMLRNVIQTVYEKVKIFIVQAGRIILAISIILWVLASFGPDENFSDAENIVTSQVQAKGESLDDVNIEDLTSAYKLEHSYIGIAGNFIEPVIKPLGYDWKIGIALITSFAAREVFVGSLATIYSVGSQEDDVATIKQRMSEEVNSDGRKTFDLATSLSLLVFYVFSMQCMSTLAIVRRETNSWRWPILQFTAMTVIAYVAAFATYQLFK